MQTPDVLRDKQWRIGNMQVDSDVASMTGYTILVIFVQQHKFSLFGKIQFDKTKMIKNNDFSTFQEEVTWFCKPTSNIQFTEGDIRLGIEFRKVFPKLTALVEKARFTILSIDQVEYLFFAWD